MDIDQKKLDIAIAYISRMADGSNPVNNRPMPEHEILNDPNVIRCMFFVKEILEEVKRNGGVIAGRRAGSGRSAERKTPEPYPFEIADRYQYQEDKSITHVLRQLQEPIEGTGIKKISPVVITGWLKGRGYLVENRKADGEKETLPTQKGEQIGIYTRDREYNGRQYVSVMYGRQAQEFIVSHLREAVDWKSEAGASGASAGEGTASAPLPKEAGISAGYEKLARKLLEGNKNVPERRPGSSAAENAEERRAQAVETDMPDERFFANMARWMSAEEDVPF